MVGGACFGPARFALEMQACWNCSTGSHVLSGALVELLTSKFVALSEERELGVQLLINLEIAAVSALT